MHIAYIILYLIFFDSKQKFNEWSISAPAVPCYPFEPSGPWSNPPISIDVHARLCPYVGPTSPVPKSIIHPKSLHITTMWQRVFINIATVFNNLHHNTRHAFYAFTINTHQTTLSNIISIIIHIFTLLQGYVWSLMIICWTSTGLALCVFTPKIFHLLFKPVVVWVSYRDLAK